MGRVRYGGARGQLTVRADSGFYTHAVVSACRETNVRFSITIRQHKSLRNLIEAIPEGTGRPSPCVLTLAMEPSAVKCQPRESRRGRRPLRHQNRFWSIKYQTVRFGYHFNYHKWNR